MSGPTDVTVIIPYYQHQSGLLARSLASIYRQRVEPHIRVSILIVDDESPLDPAGDIHEAGGLPANMSLRVLRRKNGGPGAARNTGLDAAKADVIAFLDSDDAWEAEHLSVGLAALSNGAQLFFANNQYDDDATWFQGLRCTARLAEVASKDEEGVYSISRDSILPFFMRECIAHTSTVIVDARRVQGLRFDEDLATAGEDHLFWMTAAARSDRIAFSMRPTVSRGRGMDLYRGALSWDSPECVRRIYFGLMLNKKMLERFCSTPADVSAITSNMNLLRRGIIYLFVRNAFKHLSANTWVFFRLLRNDGGFWLNLPRNAAIVGRQKLAGNLEFPAG